MSKSKIKETKLSGGLFWNPNQNDELVGTLVAIRTDSWKNDIYDIKTDKGIICVPASSVLKGVFSKESLDKKFRIKFLGWGANKVAERTPKAYRNFDVFLIEEE